MTPKNKNYRLLLTSFHDLVHCSSLVRTLDSGQLCKLPFIRYLVPKTATGHDPSKTLSRKDILVRPWGLFICVRWSKTIQFKERKLHIPIVRLPPGHLLCPVQAYERHVRLFPPHPPRPPFSTPRELLLAPTTHAVFTAKLRCSLCSAGLKPTRYSGHSFRRRGATYAFRCGAPVELISLQGDWSSDAVHLYISQPLARRISLAQSIAQNIVSLSP